MSPRIRSIIADVAQEHGLTVEAVLGRATQRHICAARWDAMYRLHYGDKPVNLSRLGEIFDRDHSAVGHGLRRWRAIQAGADLPPDHRKARQHLVRKIAMYEARIVAARARICELDRELSTGSAISCGLGALSCPQDNRSRAA